MEIKKNNKALLPWRSLTSFCNHVLAISCVGLILAVMWLPTLALPFSIAFGASMISLCILEAAGK